MYFFLNIIDIIFFHLINYEPSISVLSLHEGDDLELIFPYSNEYTIHHCDIGRVLPIHHCDVGRVLPITWLTFMG